ncbi:MAG: hypothetical protein V4456_11690 [Bacteroidota bacterium]
MKLYERLQHASSEEDVKDIYIKALGLKEYQKNLIDIQTKEIWFEAKHNAKLSSYEMFTQLMHYVQDALNKGEYIPPFLVVMDTKKAAIMKSVDVLPFLAKKTIKWGKSASGYTQEALDAISAHIGTHFISFKIETHEEEFISTVQNAIKNGDIIRTAITPDNLKQVFDKWVNMIGGEIKGVSKDNYALLFFADIMHDGTVSTHQNLPAELLHKNGSAVFSLEGKIYELGNKEGYRQFWAIYNKPPKVEYRNYLLERRDSLIPVDERSFKGAYYTPLAVVDKAYDKLEENLGKNWQKDYLVWDMCCGVGNLEVKHSNPRNLYMSTLDSADIDVMKATKTCVAAQRFQYDYLNDDINDFGLIDYSITDKIPISLRQAIAERRKILILINPPYAEATNSANASMSGKGEDTSTKEGVSKTKFALTAMSNYGKASNELFMQFIARIAQEIPHATVAIFSKLKYITAPTLQEFRNIWNAKYLGGFVVHSKSFEGLKGEFPIGFLIWKTDMLSTKKYEMNEITTEVLNKFAKPIGAKVFYPAPAEQLLTNWIIRPKANKIDALPLKNAVSPAVTTKDLRGTKWSDGAIGWLNCPGNDIQQANLTGLFSSGFSSGRGFFVTERNLMQTAIMFAVRRLVKPNWLNDRDQFLIPSVTIPDGFQNDSLVWMLFSGSNLTASADDITWNNRKWSLVNHFIPFTEVEVGSTDRFESDFMYQYMSVLQFSEESKQVLASGRSLWQNYFAHTDVRTTRDEFKLNRADVGWYQIRMALQSRNSSGDFPIVSFKPFEIAYKILTEKLLSQVYEIGFLKS